MPQRIFKRKFCAKSSKNPDSSVDTLKMKLDPVSTDGTDPISKSESTIPNRIFVGGIAAVANEWDIKQKFSHFGNVKAAKIIRDQMGFSKGYGFVTFSSEEDAKKVLEKGELILKGRKLNIAPAIKKQNSANTQVSKEDFLNEEISMDEVYRNIKSKNYNKFDCPGDYSSSLINANNYCYAYDTLTYFESCPYFGLPDISYAYGTSQVNLLSQPTVLYVPQQAFHYPGAPSTVYHVGATIPEIVHLVPASILHQ